MHPKALTASCRFVPSGNPEETVALDLSADQPGHKQLLRGLGADFQACVELKIGFALEDTEPEARMWLWCGRAWLRVNLEAGL